MGLPLISGNTRRYQLTIELGQAAIVDYEIGQGFAIWFY